MTIIANILIYGGLLAIAAGLLMPWFMGVQGLAYKIVYSIGAVAVLAGRLMTPYKGTAIRVKRLTRLQVWSALFFIVAAGMLWYSRTTQDWMAFTLAGALVQCYVSIALPYAARRDSRDKKDSLNSRDKSAGKQ